MRFLLLFFAAATMAMTSPADEAITVRVTGDRVSLRSEPNLNCEILDTAMRGEEMAYLDRTNDWVAVRAPDGLDFWVAGEFVKNGVVEPKKLNVRAGPNKNYNVVALVHGGDRLKVRGGYNNWLKIAPPEGSRVWISAAYVDILNLPKPEPDPVVAVVPEPEPEPVVVEVPVVPVPEPNPVVVKEEPKVELVEKVEPFKLEIDKSRRPQGKVNRVSGVLRREKPGLYKLVRIEGGSSTTACFVWGQVEQLESMLGRSLLIEGKVYWAKGFELPVIKPDTIKLQSSLSN